MPYLHSSEVVLQKLLGCESNVTTRFSFLVTGSPGFALDRSILERELASPLSFERKTSRDAARRCFPLLAAGLQSYDHTDSTAQQMSVCRELLIPED